MRRLLFWVLAGAIALSGCRFGQFQKDIEHLARDWEQTSGQVADLSQKVAAEQRSLNDLMNRIPLRTDLVGNFGEDYLSTTDQLSARLVGHKSRFDRLSQQILDYIVGWQEQDRLMTELRDGLASGLLPVDTPERIRSLTAFLNATSERINSWEPELQTVAGQCREVMDKMLK